MSRHRAPISPNARPRQDRIIRAAVYALIVYGLGLIPFFFLTPVGQSVQQLLLHPTSGGNEVRPSPSPSAEATAVIGVPNAGPDDNSVIDSPSAGQMPVPLPAQVSGESRYAFLLMGYGGAGHDGAELTDSLMVVIVDAKAKSLTLLSIPRDSWVPLSFNDKTTAYNKINTAFAFAKDPSLYRNRDERYTGAQGAGLFTSDTVARLLGIPVTYYLALDFQGFRQMIDAVGGIDIDVPVAFAARYPANDDPSIDASWMTIRFTKGPQHMNGERAIQYARARETIDDSDEGSDFARSRRQRLIMEAFKTRLLEPGGLIRIPQLLSIANSHVETNYAIPEAAKLSQFVLGWKDVKIYQTALTVGNYLQEATGPEGAYALVPGSSTHSWAQVQAFAKKLWDDPAAGIALAQTPIDVVNRSGDPTLSTRVSTYLVSRGYQVGTITSGRSLTESRLIDRSGGTASSLANLLRDDLGLPHLTLDTAETITGGMALELGADASDLSLSVSATNAPASRVGILKFGVWDPTVAFASAETDVPSTNRLATTPTPGDGRPGGVAEDAGSADHTPAGGIRPGQRGAPTPAVIKPVEHATPIPAPKNPNLVLVPRLVGLPEAVAQQLINESNLMTTYVNYQGRADVADHTFYQSIPPGGVLSQNPPPGTEVAPGTKVMLAVRKD